MKILDTIYHSQRNNKILPYVTCGVTCLASYIQWINRRYGRVYPCDDDEVMRILNSPAMLDKANELIRGKQISQAALETRPDDPGTPGVDESKFIHLNNFLEMLSECGRLITAGNFEFPIEYRTIDEAKEIIDSNMPFQFSAMFTKSGHFVLTVGYTDTGEWVVDDPYGNWKAGYSKEFDGNKVRYKISEVDQIIVRRIEDRFRLMYARPYNKTWIEGEKKTEILKEEVI
jgi:hypothetical protein